MGNQLKDQEKTKITYTKDMLIKNIAEECNRNKSIVRTIYNAIENKIVEFLSSANPETDVTIRLFEGISIDSEYIPEKTIMNNLTGKVMTSASKIKPKANITRYYCDKLTNYNK